MPVYYKNKATGKIEGVFSNCDTTSSKFRNTSLFERFESKEIFTLETKPTESPLPNQNLIDEIKEKWDNYSSTQKTELMKKTVLKLLEG